ncbi:unnamed protein product [Symbiodinium sp. KB8]|nr:unnamed protein product [Symbiodinium sp. KB8]
MGGKKNSWKQQQEWEGQTYRQPHGNWSVWPGARRSSRQHGQEWAPPRTQEVQFPAYDTNWKDSVGMVAVQTKRTSAQSSAGPTLTQVVQSAVNNARKMDNKLGALQAEIVARHDKFLAYKEGMRQAYQKERTRYTSDVQKLEHEIAAIHAQQQAAYQEIKQAAFTGALEMPAASQVAAQEWENMCEQPTVPESSLTQDLARLAAALAASGQGPARQQPVPMTPPRRPIGIPPMTPPAVGNAESQYEDVRMTDPYMPAENGEPLISEVPPPGLGSASRPATRQQPRAADPKRKPIKPAVPQQVKPPVISSPSLGDKLDSKRDSLIAERMAMRPFGTGPPVVPAAHPPDSASAMPTEAGLPEAAPENKAIQELSEDELFGTASGALTTLAEAFLPFADLPNPSVAIAADVDLEEVEGTPSPVQTVGFSVFAPHYQTVFSQTSVLPGEGTSSVIRKVWDLPVDLPFAYLDCAEPTVPLIDEHSISVVVFPHILDDTGHAAVIIDLSAVGGNVFAAVLPASLTAREWGPFVGALVDPRIEELDTFAGTSTEPYQWNEPLQLVHGVVLFVRGTHYTQRSGTSLDALLADSSQWRPFCNVPRPSRSPGFCLMMDSDRWPAVVELEVPPSALYLGVPSSFAEQEFDVPSLLALYADQHAVVQLCGKESLCSSTQDRSSSKKVKLSVCSSGTQVTILTPTVQCRPRERRLLLTATAEGPRTNTEYLVRFVSALLYSAKVSLFRFLAGEFGEPWPFLPPLGEDGSHTQMPQPNRHLHLQESPVEIDFVLLSIDFMPEEVTVALHLPSEVDDVMPNVQANRLPAHAALFPFLIEVVPQPYSTFGVLLAVPLWARHSLVVCINTEPCGGHLFASSAPLVADWYSLLALTNLGISAPVDIYVGSSQYPLADGADTFLEQGMLITFAPALDDAPAFYDLGAMLETGLSWGSLSDREVSVTPAAFCLCVTGGHHVLEAPHDRDVHRSDIARLLELQEDSLVVTPANPRIRDVAVRGRPCLTVVAADETTEGRVLLTQLEEDLGPTLLEECFQDSAMNAAGLWLGASTWQYRGFTVFSDCQAALSIASGQVTVHTEGVAQVLCHVASCCRTFSSDGINFVQIPGHAGIIGNELADVAAKSAAISWPIGSLQWDSCVGPDWWASQGALWSWCGVVCRRAQGDDSLPSPLGDNLVAGRNAAGHELTVDSLKPFLPDITYPVDPEAVSCGQLHLRMVSYNALSLAGEKGKVGEEGLAFKPARPALLAKQLSCADIHCAAIQEARTPEGTVHTGDFVRFCSGGLRGHFGIELWFRKNHCLVDFGGQSQLTFQPSAFVATVKDPRRLVVVFKQGGLQIVFAGLHAPPRGADPATITDWWQETEDILYRESRGRLLVIGDDCNASLGSLESESVSVVGAETQDHAGDQLHALLRKCELWAPATWEGVQTGPTWTYVQRRNGATARPDFVLLPAMWKRGDISTWTSPDIAAANSVIDHVATVADVRLRVRCRPSHQHKPAKRIDAAAVADPRNSEKLSAILREAPRPDWKVSAHDHVCQITGYLQGALVEAFPQSPRRPLHPFLSDTAWELQQQVSWLRRRCAHIKEVVRRQTLRAIFDVLCSRSSGAVEASSAWLRDAQFSLALYGFRLGVIARTLRNRCKSDRAAYVETLADQVQSSPDQAFQAVAKLLCRRRKKPYAPAVLPSIKQADGSRCETSDEAASRWREFFGGLEAGLTWIYKGRGEQSECSSFRGILLLSNLAKALHRAYRPCIQSYFESRAPPLQLGGRRGASVVFGSHVMRTFMRWRSGQGRTSAVVFADVAAAYYSTVRCLAARHPADEAVATSGSSDTPPADGDSLEAQKAAPSALARGGAEPWLQALTATLNTDTWMLLCGDSVPILTHRGTRPGSAWADLSFGVLMARILDLRDSFLSGHSCDLAITFAWDGHRSWCPPEPQTHAVPLSDLMWADDLSTCLAIDDTLRAAKIIGTSAGSLADAFESHGFDLTFGPRKTAAIFSPKGPGARAVRRELFRPDPGGIKAEIKQRVASARGAFKEGLLDAETLLRIEQLRYLRQLLGHAPDVLWALVRVDTAYLNVLREALAWLYRRVQALNYAV